MNLSFFIARKYFFSKDKKNFINVISIISMLVVGISTMALVIVLSVFNGLEDLLRSVYGTFDPDLVILPASGKSFELNDDLKGDIQQIDGIRAFSEVIEDNVAVKYKDKEKVVRLKGVSENFLDQSGFKSSIINGDPVLKRDNIGYAIVGLGVRWDMSIDPRNEIAMLQVYYPKDLGPGIVNPAQMFTIRNILPGGIFAIEKYYDDNYIFVPIEFAQDLMQFGQKRTAIELYLDRPQEIAVIKEQLTRTIGGEFLVKQGEELHSGLFNVLKIEKLSVYIVFVLIMGIASINIYFTLTMLAIDKKRDLSILTAQGATIRTIKDIFVYEGAIIALTGSLVGASLGLIITLVQQEFGLVSMGMASTLLDAYPVKLEFIDVVIPILVVTCITFLSSLRSASLVSKKISLDLL